MKKILSIAGIVCFSMLVAVGTHGIYSWFTDQSQRVNSFSVGMNEVEIREEFPDQELTPGKIIKKEAGFTNTGMVPMYVRAVYLFSNKEAEEGSELLMGSTLWEKLFQQYPEIFVKFFNLMAITFCISSVAPECIKVNQIDKADRKSVV